MKKILIAMLLMIGFALTSTAQTQWYRSTAFAIAQINQYNGRYTWSDWERSNIAISFDLTNDIITIYSSAKQIYYVDSLHNGGNVYTDGSGGSNVKFYVYDQGGRRGEIRLRIETSGNSQIYVDFADYAWVYNVIRTQ